MIDFERLAPGVHRLRATTVLPMTPDEIFPFFAEAGNLERITPPELGFRILTPTPVEMGEGTLLEYRLRLFGVPFGWRTLISGWDPPRSFTDEQLEGPYARWIHTHRFVPVAAGTRMEDEVEWALPLRPVGELAYPVVRLQLRRIFRYRQRAVERLLLGGA